MKILKVKTYIFFYKKVKTYIRYCVIKKKKKYIYIYIYIYCNLLFSIKYEKSGILLPWPMDMELTQPQMGKLYCVILRK